MLLDILGVFTAFSFIMLLLSLLVTTLSHATQHYLRLRGRNLRLGVARLIEPHMESEQQSLLVANRLLNSRRINPLNKQHDISDEQNMLIGPPITWVEANDLQELILADSEIKASNDLQVIDDDFERMGNLLSQRFTNLMTVINFVWALVIAIIFQISAPHLIQQLSVDEQYRDRVIEQAQRITDDLGDDVEASADFSPKYDAALEEMSRRYPAIREDLFALDQNTLWIMDLSEELANRIESHPDLEVILEDFERILAQDIERQMQDQLTIARNTIDELSLINIIPLRNGVEFYHHNGNIHYNHLFGIFVSALLLMLGAPFWFNWLKRLLGLRDILKPHREATP